MNRPPTQLPSEARLRPFLSGLRRLSLWAPSVLSPRLAQRFLDERNDKNGRRQKNLIRSQQVPKVRESSRRPTRWLSPAVLSRTGTGLALLIGVVAIAGLLAGCGSARGAKRTTTQSAYTQVNANALGTGKPSADSVALLHHYQLSHLLERQPDEVVRKLHELALASGERNTLFALAELSYVAGEQIRRGLRPWDKRDPRDFYLGSAVYAWLFLFGDGKESPPSAFDRRFREACDFYNYSLGLASHRGFEEHERGGQAPTRPPPLAGGRDPDRPWPPGTDVAGGGIDELRLADQFRIYGFSVRNRAAGVGTPLIVLRRLDLLWGCMERCRRPRCCGLMARWPIWEPVGVRPSSSFIRRTKKRRSPSVGSSSPWKPTSRPTAPTRSTNQPSGASARSNS